MTGAHGAGAVAVLPSQGTESAGRVLVIEDEEGISAYLAMTLDLGGYEVVCRESAFGIAALLRSWRPDVILLDLGLPYRSGAAVLADFKADPTTATIPVVVLSGAPDSLTRASAAQAATVLTKPIGMHRLLATVQAAQA